MLVFVSYVMYQEHRRAEFALETERNQRELALEKPAESSAAVAGNDLTAANTPTPVATPLSAQPLNPAGSQDLPALAPSLVIPLATLTLQNEDVIAKISNGPGLIESWELRHYDEYTSEGAIPIDLIEADRPVLQTDIGGVAASNFASARYEIVSRGEREITQRAQTAAGVLTRTIRIDESGYGFDLEVVFDNGRGDPVDASFEFLWPEETSKRQDFSELSLIAYGAEEGVTRTLVPSVGQPGLFGLGGGTDGVQDVKGRSRWAGFDIQYFAGVLIDPGEAERLEVRFDALEAKKSAEARITLPSVSISPGASVRESLRGFIGPKTPTALDAAGNGLEHSVNRGYSWLDPLTRLFEIALDKLYSVIPNYGLAIIVLTILVRICTAPLMAKQMRSAEKMRALQPRMKDLQERYKDDRQKQSEETMKLYRAEGVNPLGGCLPLLLQFPVLIGLFYALRSSIALRHAPFALWITDLSQPATLFVMPGIDFPIRVLPLIMGASMFVQQKMTPTTGMDPTQAKMMQVMMPMMMLFISYTFPSGLVLYWTVSNLLGIGHQYWIRSHTQPAS